MIESKGRVNCIYNTFIIYMKDLANMDLVLWHYKRYIIPFNLLRSVMNMPGIISLGLALLDLYRI